MRRELDQFQQVNCGERVRAAEDGFTCAARAAVLPPSTP
jgi:hypothetical protein